MNIRRTLVMACAAAMAAGAEGVVAQQLAGTSPDHPLSGEQARAAGIELLARSFGVSLEAAAARANIEAHAPDIIQSIRTQYADRLAGLYIEHEPAHRIVVRLTGADIVPSEAYQFGDDQLDVVYEVGAPHTFADLHQRFASGFEGLKRQLAGLHAGYVDERTGEIVLAVDSDGPGLVNGRDAVAISRNVVGNPLLAQQRAVDDYFGAPTRIVPMGRNENQVIYGSGKLYFTQATLSGGIDLTCTGAFTVKDNSTPAKYGLLTAGHCQAATGDYKYDGSGATVLTHVARRFDAVSDVGWAMVSTNPSDAGNIFYTGSAWQTQGLPLTKSGTAVGLSMCHYGVATTAGSCGTVASTAYNPGSICGPGLGIYTGVSACSAVYVAVDSVACASSDSGGPWFTTASLGGLYRPAGVHKAGNTASGRCVYSSTDDISGSPLNLQIL